MQEMMKMYNMYGMDPSMFGGDETLVLNVDNDLVKYMFEHADGENVEMFAQQLYDLACLANKPLAPEAMTAISLTFPTLIPAASTAWGLSPQARK